MIEQPYPNKFKEFGQPTCSKIGCNAKLSSRDVANGYKYHSEECYYGGLIDATGRLLDDPIQEDESD